MSKMRSMTDFPRNEAGLVDQFIGTAYDTVKGVYDNLDKIERVNEALDDINGIAQRAVDEAVKAEMPAVRNELQTYVGQAQSHATGAADSAAAAASSAQTATQQATSSQQFSIASSNSATQAAQAATQAEASTTTKINAFKVEVAAPTGAGIFGYSKDNAYPANTVGAALKAQDSAIGSSKSALATAVSNFTQQPDVMPVIDMHFDIQRGTGWITGEPGGQVSTTITTPHGTGSDTLTVADPSLFRVGQLIVYEINGGEYYTGTVQHVNGYELRLGRQTEGPVSAGCVIAPFYRDDAHANRHGARAIAHHARRETWLRTGRRVFLRNPQTFWTPQGAFNITLSNDAVSGSGNPMTTDMPALKLTAPANNDGTAYVGSDWFFVNDGEYEFRMPVNCGQRAGGLSGAVRLMIQEQQADGVGDTRVIGIHEITGMGGESGMARVRFSTSQGAAIRVMVQMYQGGVSDAWLGQAELWELGAFMPNMETATVVLFGDSWFTSGGDIHTQMMAAFPNANILSAGVPGNTAEEMLARFYTDVVPKNPDVVYICVGTNDFYRSVPRRTFYQQIHRIRELVRAIGAIPVFFTSCVGAIVSDAAPYLGDVMKLSRDYILKNQYVRDAQQDVRGVTKVVLSEQRITVPANGEITVYVHPEPTVQGCLLRRVQVTQPNLNLVVGYVGNADGSGSVDRVEYPLQQGVTTGQIAAWRPTGNTVRRMPAILLKNTSGTPMETAFIGLLEVQAVSRG